MAQLGNLIVNGVAKMLSTLYVSGSVTAPTFIGKLQGNADSATKVNGHTVNSDVPSGAKFTDTTYPISYKTIDGSFSTAYRTQTKGDTSAGDYISTIRNNTASVANAPQYGSGLAWGRADTHGYLYVDYASAQAYVGGGNADKLGWIRKLSFTDHSHSVGTASALGFTKLYTATGTATDGSMTQNAITTALAGKSPTTHNHDSTYHKLNIASYARNGEATLPYAKICQIKITGTYINYPIRFIAQERCMPVCSEVNIMFNSVNSTDPTLNSFRVFGYNSNWYINKSATSTWDVYCLTGEAWAGIKIMDYIPKDGVSITWTNTSVPTYAGTKADFYGLSLATTSLNGFMSAKDKSKLDYTNIAYGKCITSASTGTKIVEIDGNVNWTPKCGSIIIVWFQYTNTEDGRCNLNVNYTGAYPIYSDGFLGEERAFLAGIAGRYIAYFFDGEVYFWLGPIGTQVENLIDMGDDPQLVNRYITEFANADELYSDEHARVTAPSIYYLLNWNGTYDKNCKYSNLAYCNKGAFGNSVTHDIVTNQAEVLDKIPYIQSDGVMEVGRYIDFHNGNAAGDFNARITSRTDTPGLELSGTTKGKFSGTWSGQFNFANGTWNPVGDDVWMGDMNYAGKLCLKGNNSYTGIAFFAYEDKGVTCQHIIQAIKQSDFQIIQTGQGCINLQATGTTHVRNSGNTEWGTIMAGAFSQQSSRRYKKNIVDMTEETAKNILKYDVKRYDYINEGDGTNCEGLIAEEVAEIDDYPVIYNLDGSVEGLDYSKFVPQLIKMVQIQQKEIDTLKEQLAKISEI